MLQSKEAKFAEALKRSEECFVYALKCEGEGKHNAASVWLEQAIRYEAMAFA